MLEIRLLGDLVVMRDGKPVPLPASKKTRALLGYLAATSKPQLRERLCGLLWDGPDDPRAALRWSLTKLRPLVDDARATRLLADRDRVELVAEGATIDLGAVRAAIPGAAVAGVARTSTEALRAAALHLRGELLERLELPDCYRYDEWLRAERESTRRLGAAILVALVERTVGDEALGHARAWLALDPLEEAAHAAVMRLLIELGRKPGAMAQYTTCVRLLKRELGHEPSRALERLRIASEAAPSRSEFERAPVTAPPALPLFGRVHERSALASLIDGGARRVTLVLGDPGIGKTRLLEELAAMAHARDLEVFKGRGVEAELVRPYGAWLDALAGAGDPFRASEDQGADRTRLFEAVTAWLVARGDVVVILDDLQWIDEASAALLHYIARSPTAARVRLACGARPGELADNPAALRLIRGLTREVAVHQIGLSPLDAAETAALAIAHAPDVDAARVFAESGGHPLFAVEVARALARGDTTWGSLDALIGERLDLLDGPASEIVRWAAALGGAFDADLLASITGVPLAELARVVEELERRAIVRPVAHEWDFVHDLVRSAAYQRVSEPHRRLLHLQIARSLAGLPDSAGEGAVAVAHHAGLGGDSKLCATACLAAGQRCMRLFAPKEALVYAERGLGHSAKLVGETRIQLQIDLIALAIEAAPWQRRHAELSRDLERAILDAQAFGLHTAVARGISTRALIHYAAGDFVGARAGAIVAAQQSRGAEPETRARTLALSAQCLALLGHEMREAELLAAEAAELLAATGGELPELPYALALIRYHQGDTAAAIMLLERARVLAELRGVHWLAGYCRSRAALYELGRGCPSEAIVHCDALCAEASRFGEADVAFGAVVAAIAGVVCGPPGAPEVVSRIDTALVALRSEDAPVLLSDALTAAAEIELSVGLLDAAARHAAEAIVAAERSGRDDEVALAHALASRAAAISGRLSEARAELDLARGRDRVMSAHALAAIAAAGDALRD